MNEPSHHPSADHPKGHAARADELTGLLNRAAFLARLDAALAGSSPFVVLLLDCDHFKTINDSLGHPAGDQLLVSIAARLQACIASTDVLARIDGDEFAILLSTVSDLAHALATAEHIFSQLDDPFRIATQELFISVSIGIVTSQPGYARASDVLRDADTALHHAKELGRGHYSVFDAQMHAQVVHRLHMEMELRQALKQEEFRVFYQPIVSLDTGIITGFEALVRWQHPERQLLSPAEFLPVAEELGLSVAIDRWVLRTACEQMSAWKARFPASVDLTMSVNLSGHQLTQPDLLSFVRSVVHDTGLSPQNLSLEMTEEVLIRHRDTAIARLQHLRSMGIRVSLDDFGTGYSSLSYLHYLPVTTLKVDRSFISSIDVNPQVAVIANAIITLAHALQMDVVAEGIETIHHLHALRASRCERAQGFYFSRPVDAATATGLLEQAQRRIAATVPPFTPERAVGQSQPLPTAELPDALSGTNRTPVLPPDLTLTQAAGERNLRTIAAADQPPVERSDPLTGLLTRAALADRLAQAVEHYRHTGEPFALAVIDLDHFKSINDAFGHNRGDEVLIEFATRVSSATRAQDSIVRYGGDEFVLLLRNTSATQARVLAERLLDLVRSRPFHGDPPLTLTISAGIAVFPDDSQTIDNLFAIADQRNAQAKRSGRGRALLHDLPSPGSISLDAPARLIERDDQTQTLHSFLYALSQQSRGILELGGPVGSGVSRFLSEAATAARLRGYGVLELCGSAALKERIYGVLSDLPEEWQALPLPSHGVEPFAASLQAILDRQNLTGIVIVLDNASLVDPASLGFLQDLFATNLSRLALIFAPDGIETTMHWPQDDVLRMHIRLDTLSFNGVRTWIRHSLNWEMPDELLHWFASQTSGRPALIRRGLQYLLHHELLYPVAGGWASWPDLPTLQLHTQLASPTAHPLWNLPLGQAAFVGRERELSHIKRLLLQQRAVTIVGLGGTGKSRLAIQAAAEVVDTFADGVCYVQLAPLSSADFLIYTIADALGIALVGAQSPREQLLFHLSSRRLLLLLDNFEHLREEICVLQDIVEHAPGVHLLITSRDHLVVSGAVTVELAGLPIPSGDRVADIEPTAAGQLFVRRARQAYAEFQLTDENATSVSRICRLVEGLPLGIELAAAWTRTYSCEAIAEKIERNLAFLQRDERGIGERHRSLLAMIDSFWFLLSNHERSLLRQIAVFRGGFDGSAARQIIDASPFFLEGLVAKGYLRWTRQKRYEIHELLRQYAAEKLRALPDEERQAGARHSAYYLALLQRRDLQQFGSRHLLAEISSNLENVRTAWQWALRDGRLTELAASIDGLEAFYDYKGMFHEAEALFSAAAAQLAAQFNQSAPLDPLLLRLVGQLHAVQARFLIRCSRYDDAIQTAQHVVDEAVALHDASLEAAGAYHWGTALWHQGIYEPARQQLSRAADIARQLQLVPLHADSLRRLSRVACERGDYADARALGEQSLVLCRQAGDRQRETRTLNDLGIVADSQGDYIASKSYYERCLLLCRELGDQPGEANALMNLGAVAADQGDYSVADHYLEQALRLFRESGNLRDESIVLENLGDSARGQGELDRAAGYYTQALRICRTIGDRQGQTYVLSNLGLIAHQRGDPSEARAASAQALELAQEIGDSRAQGHALTCLGHACSDLQAFAEARTCYQQAVQRFRELGQLHLCADAMAGLARLSLAQGAADEAKQHVEPILAYLEAGTLDGSAEPVRIYLSCYQVLQAGSDPRAVAVLRSAVELVQQRAARITVAERRNRFLQQIPAHQEVLRAAHEHAIITDYASASPLHTA